MLSHVFNRIRFEQPTANALNTIHTCHALARAGVKVVIHADLGRTRPRRILKAAGERPHPNLALRQMRAGYHAFAVPFLAPAILRRHGARRRVAIFSEVRGYVPAMIERARRRGFVIVFEAHNAAGLMAQAECGARRLRRQTSLERAILARVDLLVAPNRRTLEAIRALAPAGIPAFVLPNGALLPPASAAAPGKEIDVLYAGSLLPWKGVDTIVRAMAHLAPYRLTVLGGRKESDRRALRDLASSLGCADRVTFLEPVPSKEVASFYARARVGVVPLNPAYLEAREFTCPVKMMEMMGAGLPIVCAKLPSIQEFVADGEEVLMAASDDPLVFASAIRRLLEDPDLADRLAAAARVKASEFSFERRAERLRLALRELFDARGRTTESRARFSAP